MKIVFFTVTGQTKRFIKKLGSNYEYFEIDAANPFFEVNDPFVLITPTYDKQITEPINDFLEYQNNSHYLKGIVGTGNRNFAELFIFTAKNLSYEYHVPLIYAFEFNGTPTDVSNFKKAVKELESKGHWY